MSFLKNTICLLALFALLSVTLGQSAQGGSHTSQGGAHENQGRAKRQADQVEPQVEPQVGGVTVNWTSCDPAVTPKYTCLDCNTRLICLPIGGKTISCPKVYAPYCNDGYCSPVPSVDCQ